MFHSFGKTYNYSVPVLLCPISFCPSFYVKSTLYPFDLTGVVSNTPLFSDDDDNSCSLFRAYPGEMRLNIARANFQDTTLFFILFFLLLLYWKPT